MKKISRLIKKNLNIVKQYGILGSLRIYYRLMMWYLFHTVAGKADNYVLVRVNDYRMYINLKDRGISRDLFVYGTREADQMYIVRKVLKSGMPVLDIGANIGYYVILESSIIGRNSKIVVYEPSKENCALLKKNLELNDLTDMVELNNDAVSNRAGISRFYLSEKSNLHTLNPVSYKGDKKREEGQDFVDVKTADIYEVLKRHRDIGFIRMDIEGHEVEVLEGIARAVKELKIYPGILFETHFPKYDSAKHDVVKSLNALFSLGYTPKYIASNNERLTKAGKEGYAPTVVIRTDRVRRGIYEDIPSEVAVDLISALGGVRAVFLEGKSR